MREYPLGFSLRSRHHPPGADTANLSIIARRRRPSVGARAIPALKRTGLKAHPLPQARCYDGSRYALHRVCHTKLPTDGRAGLKARPNRRYEGRALSTRPSAIRHPIHKTRQRNRPTLKTASPRRVSYPSSAPV